MFEEFCKELGEAGKKVKPGPAWASSAPAAAGGGSSGKAATAGSASALGGKAAETEFEAMLEEAAATAGSSDSDSISGSAVHHSLSYLDSLTLQGLEARWGADPRWQRCTAQQRGGVLERWVAAARQVARQGLEAAYRALLRERGVTAATRWTRAQEDSHLSGDPRFLALPRGDRCVRACAPPPFFPP